jgi:hypothetical protein
MRKICQYALYLKPCVFTKVWDVALFFIFTDDYKNKKPLKDRGGPRGRGP